MDSCVTAAIAKDLNYNLYFLHVNYGQRTENKEFQAFENLKKYFNAKELVVDISYLKEIGGSSLTDENIEVEKGDVNRQSVPKSYVPFRNANILSIATSWAEVLNATDIFIGAVEEDSSGYPDCRKTFYDAFNTLIERGTRPETKIKIQTPLINLKKSEIIKLGIKLNAPLNLTWSCYKSEDKACGVCDSCLLRLRGFKEAGIKDPIDYKIIPSEYKI
jgi:7-cyano-7-deazaguanine synthase